MRWQVVAMLLVFVVIAAVAGVWWKVQRERQHESMTGASKEDANTAYDNPVYEGAPQPTTTTTGANTGECMWTAHDARRTRCPFFLPCLCGMRR